MVSTIELRCFALRTFPSLIRFISAIVGVGIDELAAKGELEFAKQIRDRLAAGVVADKVEPPVRERLERFIRGLERRNEPR